MRPRIKWICAGAGVIYAVQLAILLIVHNFIPLNAPPAFSNLLATVVYTLVAFMAGGFVIGLMAERIRIVEPVIATVIALAIDVLSTQVASFSGVFLFSTAVGEDSASTVLALGAVAIVAALAGGLAGERLAVPEGWVDQTLEIAGLAGLIVGPFVLISSVMALPIAVVLLIVLILLVGIWFVSKRFREQDLEEEAMSIRPESLRTRS